MKHNTKMTCFKYSTYAGCFLLLIPNEIAWYWGNMSVYTDSYLSTTQGLSGESGTPWTVSFYVTVFGVGVLASDLIARCIGQRWAIVVGFLLNGLTLCLSYIAIQTSKMALSAVMGIAGGIASGIMYSQVLVYVVLWSTNHVGLITGFVTTGVMAGALLINIFVTFYINPSNESPDLVIGPTAYFTQPDILQRVPSMFLVFGSVAFIWHLIAFMLIRDVPVEKENKDTNMTSDQQSDTNIRKVDQVNLTKDHETKDENSHLTATASDGFTQNSVSYTESPFIHLESIFSPDQNGTLQCHIPVEEVNKECNDLKESCMEGHRNAAEETEPNVKYTKSVEVMDETMRSWYSNKCCNTVQMDLTTLQMLKTGRFYIMWLGNLIADFSYIMMTNSYKKFGQQWITDDHFLTDVGVVTVICAICMRICWGALVDRLGIKYTCIGFLTSLSIASVYWYFTPMLSKWLFMIWTALFGSTNNGLYVVFAVTTFKMFGKKYYIRNYAVLLTASIVLNFVGPPAVQALLHNFGWWAVFSTNGALLTLGLMLVVFCLPRI